MENGSSSLLKGPFLQAPLIVSLLWKYFRKFEAFYALMLVVLVTNISSSVARNNSDETYLWHMQAWCTGWL